MFDVGWGEMLVIGVVALIVIGPKELPTVLRAIGQWTGKIRRMASEFQSQFQEALREAEVADLQKQITDASQSLSSQLDPLDLTPSSSTAKSDERAPTGASTAGSSGEAPDALVSAAAEGRVEPASPGIEPPPSPTTQPAPGIGANDSPASPPQPPEGSGRA